MLPGRRRGRGAAQQRGVQLMSGLQPSDPLASLLGTTAPAGHYSLGGPLYWVAHVTYITQQLT